MVPRARDFGVAVSRVGVKDVVLPGEMKTLLNRVIEAEKEAAANVITRREEAAATRSMANTARAFAEQPLLLELKRLETLKEIAGKVGAIKLVMGADGFDERLRDTELRRDEQRDASLDVEEDLADLTLRLQLVHARDLQRSAPDAGPALAPAADLGGCRHRC
jgi:malate/lactate dehydrogenase